MLQNSGLRYYNFTFFVIFFAFRLNSQILWNIKSDTSIVYYYEDGDEFSSNDLKKNWESSYGWARSIASNKEQQYYSDYQNHELNNGCLNLTVEKKYVHARLVDWLKDHDSIKSGRVFDGLNKRHFKYTAGMIASKKEYLKGYFEMKFKAPKEAGLWPAFWLYGGSPNEEIDFMEGKGERENEIHVDTHCPGHCDYQRNAVGVKKSFGGWIKLTGKLNEGYNIVSGIWGDDFVKFYLNGEYVAEAKVQFNKPKALVANIAVPSNDGPFHPGPDTTIVNFSPMSIDYIRVWSRDKNKAASKLIVAENEKPLDNIKMKRRVKFLYGTKKSHDNEGIFFSIMNCDDNSMTGYCNGLKKGESCKIIIKDEAGKVIFEKDNADREFKIPLGRSARCNIEITYLKQTVRHTF
ncbi:MAG: glycoside hydrolase family 16 protein [Bacteroidia bacterium]